jgi:hypothetical protein
MEQRTSFVWNPILGQYLVNASYRMNRREGATTCLHPLGAGYRRVTEQW